MATKKQLQEQLDEIKEIYEWNDEMDTDFIGSVKEREEIFEKYYGCPDIKEKYEKLQEENEKLNSNGQEQHDHYENEILDLKLENEKLINTLTSDVKKQFQGQMDEFKKERDCVVDFCNHVEEYMTHWADGNPPPSASNSCLGCRLGGFLEFHNLAQKTQIKGYEKLKEENENLKKQIPKKPRKCLSQKDKETLGSILFWVLMKKDDENLEVKVKLLERLLN